MSRVLTILLVLSWSLLMAQQAKFSYVGVNTCRMCHKNAEKGNQHGAWSKWGHARTFESLKSAEALKVAREQGLKTPPHEAAECLVCHTTGWGKAGGYEVLSAEFVANPENSRTVKKNDTKANVGCESCHGPGSKYKSKKIMTGIFSDEINPATVEMVAPVKNICLTCHNKKSPTYREFDFDVMIAKIAHPYPEKFRATKGTSGKK